MIHYPLEVSGTLTRVLQDGTGDDYVVFLHGAQSTANRWLASLAPVAERGACALAVDLPGRGFAVQTHGSALTVPAFADFVVAFLDEMQIESAALVGASLGGHVAAQVACDHPGRVKTLVLDGPAGLSPWDRDDRQRTWDAYRGVTREAIATSIEKRRHRPAHWDEVEEAFRMSSTPSHRRVVDEMIKYMMGGGWEADFVDRRLALVTPSVPTLIAWGEDDTIFPVADGRAVHDTLPGSYLAVVAGSNHDVDLDRPDIFFPLLFDAVDGTLTPTASDDVVVTRCDGWGDDATRE